MRPEPRALLVVALLLAGAALGAAHYGELMSPFYAVAAQTLGETSGWQVVSADVRASKHGPGRVVALTAEFYAEPAGTPHGATPAARVVSEVQVGAVAEGPVVLLAILSLWPLAAGVRRRRLWLAGLPALLVLELLTTVPQLMHAMPAVAAMAAGAGDRVTLLDRWSEFIEGGGRFALACTLAVLTASLAGRARR
jgi:hypothetical protein